MKNLFKLLIIKILRFILKLFYVFPVKKDLILFSSFEGRSFNDNPKYLFDYIRETSGNKYRYVWVFNSEEEIEGTYRTVKFLSLKHIYYLMTAGFIFSNLGIEPFIPKRKKQIFVNTWHGSGAYKSQTLSGKFGASRYNIDLRDYRGKITDYYVSGCQKYSEIMSDSWNSSIDKYIPSGTPRNDLFFENYSQKRTEIQKRLNLNPENGYVMYAPTFRGANYRNQKKIDFNLDFQKIILAFEKKYGKKYMLLYREHIGTKEAEKMAENIIDVSAYPDMQELMLISDALITDYSSSMWDYSFLYRPGFLFVPDIEEYLGERDFYTPIETWPFDFAKTNDELVKLIENYDETTATQKMKLHQEQLGSFENGNASKKIVEYLKL